MGGKVQGTMGREGEKGREEKFRGPGPQMLFF